MFLYFAVVVFVIYLTYSIYCEISETRFRLDIDSKDNGANYTY